MNVKIDIPENWSFSKLQDVAEVLDNLRKPINSSERIKRIEDKKSSELYPYYGATGQVGWIDHYLTDGEYVLVGEDGAPFLDFYKPKAYVIKGKTWVNNHAHILKYLDGISTNSFILHYLNHFNYNGYVNGTTRLKLTKSSLVDIPFPLPPLPEQHRIVVKIEELFSSLDKGIESLKTAQKQLKVYRQAVLKWAFEGKLTNENMKDGELPEGWKWITIGELSSKVTVGHVGSMRDEYIDHGIPFLRGQNVKTNKYDPNGLKYISCEFHNQLSKSKIHPDDILVVRSGNVGTACVVPDILEEANCSDLVIIRKPFNTNSYYISYYLNSVIQSRILDEKVGVALGHFNTKSVEKFIIPLPSPEQQQLIVAEIESRLSVCDKIEESIEYSLKEAEALRQSILKKAFEGKLVPQDPDDEPASVLLERIRAERASKQTEKSLKPDKRAKK